MCKSPGSDADVNFVGRVEQQIAPQKCEHGVEHQRDGDPDSQHVEGREAFVDEDLINYQLKEDWHRQAKPIEH